jgi:hypothetical protein
MPFFSPASYGNRISDYRSFWRGDGHFFEQEMNGCGDRYRDQCADQPEQGAPDQGRDDGESWRDFDRVFHHPRVERSSRLVAFIRSPKNGEMWNAPSTTRRA